MVEAAEKAVYVFFSRKVDRDGPDMDSSGIRFGDCFLDVGDGGVSFITRVVGVPVAEKNQQADL